MAWVAVAVVGGSVVSGMMASDAQSEAASTAAGAQTQASAASIAEQRRQFDAVQALLKPYIDAGTGAIGAQQNLLGLGGAAAQKTAIGALQQSPQFQAMQQQGENALLQNASATGGLRGGNIQAALAQFRPQLLSQLIDQQFGRLGTVSGLGQASAAGQAAAAQQTGQGISEALQQAGAANAGAALAAGQGQAQMWGNIGSSIGNVATLKALKVF
jgi:hypothetical protein